MKNRKWILILWIAAIVFPLNWLRRESTFVRQNFDAAFQAEWVHIVMHLILFAGLVVLLLSALRLPRTPRSALVALVILLAVAVTQEMLQLQVKARPFGGPEWFDLGVDLVGGAIGWWVHGKISKRRAFEKTRG
jgi:hypothetical protein